MNVKQTQTRQSIHKVLLVDKYNITLTAGIKNSFEQWVMLYMFYLPFHHKTLITEQNWPSSLSITI